MKNQAERSAIIIDIQTTRNGYVIAQMVETDDNGSLYKLVGSDMLPDGREGDRLHIVAFANGAAHRVASSALRSEAE